MSERYEVIEDAYLPTIDMETGEVEEMLVAEAGDVVYPFFDATYGVVTDEGLAVVKVPGETPFFEVARSNLRPFREVDA